MNDFLRFGILGLGIGGIYALVSQGLVLIYRGSGVLNLAQGAIGYLGATLFYAVGVQHGLPLGFAALVGVLSASVLGVLMHLLVIKPMRKASALTKLLATLGAMLTITNFIAWQTKDAQRTMPQILPKGSLTFPGHIVVGSDRVAMFVIALIVSAVLWFVYAKTRFGVITSAAAENEDSAAALGHSPDRIAITNWIIGSGLAGVAGILIAPVVGLTPDTLTFLVVPALACALIGGFRSFVLTFIGAIGIGVLQSEIARYTSFAGWPESVPFVLIILVLFFRGKPLPVRRHVAEALPRVGSGRVSPLATVIMTGVAAGVSAVLPGPWQLAVATSFAGVLLCLSLVVVTGLAGQLSLCQMGFAGVAAWAAGRLAADYHLPFLLALVAGAALMIPLGLLVGIPALRTRGVSLAIATLGVALVFENLVTENTSLTGGFSGTTVPTPTIFGLRVDSATYPWRYGLVSLAFAVVAAVAVANLRRSGTGRRLIAVRGSERAAASIGIGVLSSKLYAFTLSAVIAGVAGVLLAFQNSNIVFTAFDSTESLTLVLYAVLAGVGFVSGGIFGGFLFIGGLVNYAAIVLFHSGELYQAVAAALLVAALVRTPDGLISRHIEQGRWIALRIRPSQSPAEDHGVSTTSGIESFVPPKAMGPDTERPKRATVGEDPGSAAVPAVRVRGLSVTFGGVAALSDVSFAVYPGEVLGLIGPNGAGKTTAVDAISGFVPGYKGSIELSGVAADRLSAAGRARLGLGRTFQAVELFEDLTVLENLLVASNRPPLSEMITDLARPRRPALSDLAKAAVEEFDLGPILGLSPRELSHGRRRLVGIARAVSAPIQTLLLDEPAAGLDSRETRELGDLIKAFATRQRVAVLIVEHDFDLIMDVCDRVVALDFGKVIADDTPEQVRNNPLVRSAYLGIPASAEGEIECSPIAMVLEAE